jgi:hypothetical protein
MDVATGSSHAGLVADAVRTRRSASTAFNSRVVASWRRCVDTYSLATLSAVPSPSSSIVPS